MTSKFKVGDKVEIIANRKGGFAIGTKGVICYFEGSSLPYQIEANNDRYWHTEDELKLIDSKPNKNQRITALEVRVDKLEQYPQSSDKHIEALENKVSELELIVHQLRKSNITIEDIKRHLKIKSPSEVFVASLSPITEDIIEFEGNQYRKVDRGAREGDVVIFNDVGNSDFFKVNVPYKVLEGMKVKGSCIYRYDVYTKEYNRTLETVDVYELIKEGLTPLILIADETVELTPNQQRAEIVEKAKKFVEKHKNNQGHYTFTDKHWIDRYCNAEFIVNEEKSTVVVLLRGFKSNKIYARGIAKCNPSDVFNEHIGKAIALGRALGLDVSEFENAVQPTEFAVGQIVTDKTDDYIKPFKIHSLAKSYSGEVKLVDNDETWLGGSYGTIINDTNAQYGGVE